MVIIHIEKFHIGPTLSKLFYSVTAVGFSTHSVERTHVSAAQLPGPKTKRPRSKLAPYLDDL